MEKHKKTLGILLICYAILKVVLFIVGLQILSAALQFVVDDAELLFATYIVKYIIGTVVAFYAIPAVIAGIGLLQHKKWALILALIIGVISLPVFPLGTAVGVYAIIVFLMDQSPTYNPKEATTTQNS